MADEVVPNVTDPGFTGVQIAGLPVFFNGLPTDPGQVLGQANIAKNEDGSYRAVLDFNPGTDAFVQALITPGLVGIALVSLPGIKAPDSPPAPEIPAVEVLNTDAASAGAVIL